MSAAPIYPLSALRTLALHTQGLSSPLAPGDAPAAGPHDLRKAVEQVGCVQIDTLQRVQRSQYLALWSRLGAYQPKDFDHLSNHAEERCLFEYWGHAAAYIPLQNYRYYLPAMQRRKLQPRPRTRAWLEQEATQSTLLAVRQQIEQRGPQRTADFESPPGRRGAWWDWKPAKEALEHLFNTGELMIRGRVNFQRIYDLRERVLPAWVDTRMPEPGEANRFFIEQGARALGACLPDQCADYSYMNLTPTRPIVRELLAEGVFVPIQSRLLDGKDYTLVVHRDNLPLLEQAADGALPARRTTFLSFFDSLFWAKDRDTLFWGYENTLEAYKPAPTRRWGYFCLSILHGDQLVGRFDPRLERANKRLVIEAIYLEPGVAASDELVAGIAAALRDFMRFHHATELVFQRAQPAELAERLLHGV